MFILRQRISVLATNNIDKSTPQSIILTRECLSLTLSDFVLSYRPPMGLAAARIEVLAFNEA